VTQIRVITLYIRKRKLLLSGFFFYELKCRSLIQILIDYFSMRYDIIKQNITEEILIFIKIGYNKEKA